MTFEEIFDEQARKTKLFICEEYIAKVTTPQLELFDVEECKRIYGLDNGDVEYEILEVKEVE